MAEENGASWKELCSPAMETRDPDKLLEIVRELSQVLKRQERVGRDFQETRTNKSSEEARC